MAFSQHIKQYNNETNLIQNSNNNMNECILNIETMLIFYK